MNFKLPAEYEIHQATWIGWPHNKSDWPGKFSAIPFVYAEIVKHISRGETVRIIVESKDHHKKAEKLLKDSDGQSIMITNLMIQFHDSFQKDLI